MKLLTNKTITGLSDVQISNQHEGKYEYSLQLRHNECWQRQGQANYICAQEILLHVFSLVHKINYMSNKSPLKSSNLNNSTLAGTDQNYLMVEG